MPPAGPGWSAADGYAAMAAAAARRDPGVGAIREPEDWRFELGTDLHHRLSGLDQLPTQGGLSLFTPDQAAQALSGSQRPSTRPVEASRWATRLWWPRPPVRVRCNDPPGRSRSGRSSYSARACVEPAAAAREREDQLGGSRVEIQRVGDRGQGEIDVRELSIRIGHRGDDLLRPPRRRRRGSRCSQPLDQILQRGSAAGTPGARSRGPSVLDDRCGDRLLRRLAGEPPADHRVRGPSGIPVQRRVERAEPAADHGVRICPSRRRRPHRERRRRQVVVDQRDQCRVEQSSAGTSGGPAISRGHSRSRDRRRGGPGSDQRQGG